MIFIAVIVLTFVLQFFLPWYVVALVPLAICSVVRSKHAMAFLQSFLAIFVLWGVMALYKDIPNHALLSSKVAEIFFLHSSALLLVVTAVLGGLVGGVGGLTGSYLRAWIRN